MTDSSQVVKPYSSINATHDNNRGKTPPPLTTWELLLHSFRYRRGVWRRHEQKDEYVRRGDISSAHYLAAWSVFIIGDPIPIGSPIIVTIWKVVFANKSRKCGWIWMKLGRWGWGLKRLSLARFQRNRSMGFGESAKKWVAEALFLCDVNQAPLLPLSLDRFPPNLSTNTCPGGGSRHMVSYSRKVSIKGSNFPKNRFRVL